MKSVLPTTALSIAPESANAEAVTKSPVKFEFNGQAIAGDLYLPLSYDPSQKYPATVVGGSLTSVKEMMSGDYARRLAAQGIIALAIDYRNFGQSDGDARQVEDPEKKAEDLSAAVTYLLSRDDVADGSVGLLGICTSGGNVLYAAARDARVGAVAIVAGWFAEPALTPMLYGSENAVDTLRRQGQAALERFHNEGENDLILAYHDTDSSASHVGPMEYYMDDSRGGGVGQWRNEFSVMSWQAWLDFDPVSRASRVTAPTLIVHSDDSALPEQARKVHDLLAGPKTLHWAEGAHFDFYDQPTQICEAVDVIAAHFRDYLVPR